MKKRSILIVTIFVLSFLLVFTFQDLRAVDVSSIAKNLKLADQQVSVGDIVSKTEKGVVRSRVPYDPNLVGIVGKSPILVFGRSEQSTVPVIFSGRTLVRASNLLNGKIRKGDFITSSTKPGIGQRATESGFVIGKALSDLNQDEGLVEIETNIQYLEVASAKKSLSGMVTGVMNELKKPENVPQVLRYISAAFLGIGIFFAGFFAFVRSLQKGVEAIGRNPLAKGSIHLAMILNLLGIVILTLGGLALTLFILVYK